MPKVNPEILTWARETAGLTLEEASQKLRISQARGVSPPDRLAALEAGEVEPTRPLLVKMAKQYRRPLLVFYMSAPPREGDRGQDFRKLPKEYLGTFEPLVQALIRDVQARQSIIRAVLEDEDEAEPLSFVGSMKMSDGVEAVVTSIRETVEIDLAEFRGQQSPTKAFQLLRSGVEALGVFVLLIGDLGSHHTQISLEAFRGFALADDVAPFIIINDQDARSAWSFTLIHELAHIWLGQTGISNIYPDKDVEKFCNEVAGEFLLPKEELSTLDVEEGMSFKETRKKIGEFARARNLSSSMVAYSLLRTGKIDHSTWRRLSQEFEKLWRERKEAKREEARKKDGGPNYYVVRRHRLGTNLISLVQRMMAGGALTTTKAGKVLGIRAKYVQKLLELNNSNNARQLA
jgi:Zn-dependent peptidase ImmA (M78 family)/transcriptional regulator with XRE-family HTH domain